MSQEEWKPVVGYEGLYEVSRSGEVRGVIRRVMTKGGVTKPWKGRPIRPFVVAKDGHLRIRLSNAGTHKKHMVHRLVLEAFVGPCPTGMQCCHNDGNPRNNAVDNLRWDTPKSNWADSVRHGTSVRGEKQGSAKLTEEIVREIRAKCRPVRGYRGPTSAKNLALKYGVTVMAILRVVHNKSWRHIQ